MRTLIASIVISSSLLSLSPAAPKGPASVFHTDRTPDGKPVAIILLTASSDDQDVLTTQYIFQSEKGFLGPSSNPSDQSGFANQDNSVFGVSYEPVTNVRCYLSGILGLTGHKCSCPFDAVRL